MELSNLLQTKEWEELEKALGNATFWVNDCLLVKYMLPKGKSYLYCPRGPRELIKELTNNFIELANKEKVIFVRFEPTKLELDEIKKYKLKKTINLNPANTLVLDLSKSEDQLLTEMKQKTRYNLNLAKKKGVEIEVSTDPKMAEVFFEIMKQTSERDKFGAHTLNHYKKLLEILGPKGIMKVYLAKFEEKYIAANIVSFYGNTASYLHGASANEFRNVMAPYLLQWQAISDAKKAGFKYYDFWGIAPDDNPKHRWAGVTRFKKGFGGVELNFPGTYDLVISKPWYLIYKIVRFLNRIF